MSDRTYRRSEQARELLWIGLAEFLKSLSDWTFRFGSKQAVFLFTTAVVPIVDKACSLGRLSYDIGCMTSEEQVVPRLHAPGWGEISSFAGSGRQNADRTA